MRVQDAILLAKGLLFTLLCIGILWVYKDYKYYKFEAKVQTENNHQKRLFDSLRLAIYKMTPEEIKEHIIYNDANLKKKLEESNIKLNRIEKLINSKYSYRDTIKSETNITSLVSAIKNSIPKSQPWVDSTKCLTTRGIVSFDGDNLKVIVNNREFANQSNSVSYWQRKQWSFLGIKSRLFGKVEVTSKVFDICGETKTELIEKRQ